ncbi:hypothetical protein HDV05_001340 [Chytridiales sp. JEL 0842]|nr:hypothetical protein HDV05_001340 [Chytridiales sp. JEL 0842]
MRSGSSLSRAKAALKPSNPCFFHQTVIHSDGSSFTLRTTSPKALLTLTKDVRNHFLWNPSVNLIDDKTGELSKFAQRFGDVEGSLDELSSLGIVAAPAPKAAPKATPTPTPAPVKKKK